MPFDAPLEDALTLTAMVERSIAKYPDKVAYSCLGAQLTYREFDRLATAFSAYLQSAGFSAGDHIALMLPNSLVYPICVLGILRAGMTVISVNPNYTLRELDHQLTDAEADAIVAPLDSLPLIRKVTPDARLRKVIFATASDLEPASSKWQPDEGAMGQDGAISLGAVLRIGRESPFSPPPVDADDIAFLQYTGGTTGVSKGAALSHANLLANAIQQTTWLQGAFVRGDTSCITSLPLYHIFPINVMFLLLRIGGTSRLMPNPRDLKQLLAEMKRAPFHVMPGVNTLFNGLLASGELRKEDFAAVRIIMGAGASVLEATAGKWKEATGVPITEGYGLTECSPGVTFNALGDGWTGTVGYPFPSTDVLIIDAAGDAAPLGVAGELCVKGPQVFAGYWKRPEESSKVFTKDGWFRTGDVATMDETGKIRIVDRLKDMILVSAFNVYPNEIEAVVAMLPAVLECACVGLPDERSGEAPHLFIVRRADGLSAEEVTAHCRANLTAYKVPRSVTFVEALPKSPVGKILRRKLRDDLASTISS